MDAINHDLPLDPAALKPRPQKMEPAMKLALDANFGSVLRWQDEFFAMGKAQGGGSGLARLVFQPREGSLVNQWAGRQPREAADGVPILELDLHDQAHPAGGDIDALMAGIDWAAAQQHYRHAVYAASEPFGAGLEEIGSAQLLDVRRAGVYEQARAVIPGARWRDPAAVADWSSELPADRELVVYCVYGHEVSRATALRLRAAGIDARFLRGGIDGWQAAGRPVADGPGSSST
jgi:Fe-Mn family superoxide dismutase